MRLLTFALAPVELALTVAIRGGQTALSAVRAGYGLVAGAGATVDASLADTPLAPRPAPSRPSTNGGEPAAAPTVTAPPPPEPDHVGEEPELVAEFAEPGAEEGAGPEIHVDEPWPGYDRMRAVEIKERLIAGGAELAAAVRLYEASRKGRRSVLEAATRGMSA